MRFNLLGASQSGKTVFWSALFHEFQHDITLPPLTASLIRAYKARNIDSRVGFRINVRQGVLLDQLVLNSEMLKCEPITDWPEKTNALNNSVSDIHFDFVSIPDGRNRPSDTGQTRSYQRVVEVNDPPGEAFTGVHKDSPKIIASLKQDDASIVFLPMDAIKLALRGDEVEETDIKTFTINTAIASIYRILREIRDGGKYGDVFPVCFVISKADECDEETFERVEDFLFNENYGIISRLSRDNPDMMICVCPVSVRDPNTGSFRAMNLEWPFLFTAASTIYRNQKDLLEKSAVELREAYSHEKRADDQETKARSEDERANALAARSFFVRLKRRLWDGETVVGHQRTANHHRRGAAEQWETARSYRNSAGRKVEIAKDDLQLALDTWSSLSAESEYRRIRILIEGEQINNIADRMK